MNNDEKSVKEDSTKSVCCGAEGRSYKIVLQPSGDRILKDFDSFEISPARLLSHVISETLVSSQRSRDWRALNQRWPRGFWARFQTAWNAKCFEEGSKRSALECGQRRSDQSRQAAAQTEESGKIRKTVKVEIGNQTRVDFSAASKICTRQRHTNSSRKAVAFAMTKNKSMASSVIECPLLLP